MKILIAPDKTLNKISKKIHSIDKSVEKLIDEMEKTLLKQKDPQGVGLSAPQVGILKRLFVVTDLDTKVTRHFINPVIIDTDEKGRPGKNPKKDLPLEGCLSIPRIWGYIRRPYRVKISYITANQEIHEEWFEDFDSLVIQHEIDHLDGILFTQRAVEQNARLFKETKGELVEIDHI